MPLNDREQKILEEIERQFYADDPKLAQTVARTTLESVSQKWTPVAIAGFVVGLIIMLAFFTSQVLVAGAGFVLMVISAGWIAMDLRRRAGVFSRRSSGRLGNCIVNLLLSGLSNPVADQPAEHHGKNLGRL